MRDRLQVKKFFFQSFLHAQAMTRVAPLVELLGAAHTLQPTCVCVGVGVGVIRDSDHVSATLFSSSLSAFFPFHYYEKKLSNEQGIEEKVYNQGNGS